jgi:enterochelin esterase-like enzyme
MGYVAGDGKLFWLTPRVLRLGQSYLESARLPRGRIHLDVGTGEGAETLRDARALKRLLEEKGIDGRMAYAEDRGAKHEEAAWARRIAGALAFLLTGR